MSKAKRITDIRDCIGKTVLDVYDDEVDVMGIRFHDGSYIYAQISDRHGDPGEDYHLDLEWQDPTGQAAVAMGLMSQAEFERQKAEQEAIDRKFREDDERREYERLKAKFETKGATDGPTN